MYIFKNPRTLYKVILVEEKILNKKRLVHYI